MKIIEKYINEDKKPAQISKEIKVPVELVYQTMTKYKKDRNSTLKEEGN